MENNQKDFMKNRPVASTANQIKDVYSSQSSSTRTTVSAVLAVLMLILTVIALIYGSYLLLCFFAPVLIVLVISFFVGRRADRYNAPVEPSDHPEALFKDHEI